MNVVLYFFLGLIIMMAVTYIPRALPLSLMRKKVENRFLLSLLYYLPYAVLGAMTFPAILYSTDSSWSALVGMIVAFILSFLRFNLLPVALASTAAVFVTEYLLKLGGLL